MVYYQNELKRTSSEPSLDSHSIFYTKYSNNLMLKNLLPVNGMFNRVPVHRNIQKASMRKDINLFSKKYK